MNILFTSLFFACFPFNTVNRKFSLLLFFDSLSLSFQQNSSAAVILQRSTNNVHFVGNQNYVIFTITHAAQEMYRIHRRRERNKNENLEWFLILLRIGITNLFMLWFQKKKKKKWNRLNQQTRYQWKLQSAIVLFSLYCSSTFWWILLYLMMNYIHLETQENILNTNLERNYSLSHCSSEVVKWTRKQQEKLEKNKIKFTERKLITEFGRLCLAFT